MTDTDTSRSDYEDSLQETAYAPTRYSIGSPSDRVTYRNVVGDGGAPIGVVYLSAQGALGTLFYPGSGDVMNNLMTSLTQLYAQSVPPERAYETLTSTEGVQFGDEDADVLSNLITPSAVTAAATDVETQSAVDLPDGTTVPLPEQDSLYVTQDDDGTVLDLVFSDQVDVYLRQSDATWSALDNTDTDPIDGRVIVDVDPSYIRAYDLSRSSDDTITDADIEQYRTNVG